MQGKSCKKKNILVCKKPFCKIKGNIRIFTDFDCFRSLTNNLFGGRGWVGGTMGGGERELTYKNGMARALYILLPRKETIFQPTVAGALALFQLTRVQKGN